MKRVVKSVWSRSFIQTVFCHVIPVLWPLLTAVWVIHGDVAWSSPLQSETHKQMYVTFRFDFLNSVASFSSPDSLDIERSAHSFNMIQHAQSQWEIDTIMSKEVEYFILKTEEKGTDWNCRENFNNLITIGVKEMGKQLSPLKCTN